MALALALARVLAKSRCTTALALEEYGNTIAAVQVRGQKKLVHVASGVCRIRSEFLHLETDFAGK